MSMKLTVVKFKKNSTGKLDSEFEFIVGIEGVYLNEFLEKIIWNYVEKISTYEGEEEEEVILQYINNKNVKELSLKIDNREKERMLLLKEEKGNETREKLFDEVYALIEMNKVIKNYAFARLEDSDVKLVLI